MRVVLPIAAIVAILITAGAVSGGSKLTERGPVDLEPGAPVAASVTLREAAYPVAFDPFTGWGVAGLQHGAADPGPAAALPLIEVDPFDRYGVDAPTVPLVRAVAGPWDWRSFAEVRAWYADPGADALPAAGTGPAVTGAWWETAPLDAK
ncbi:MAG: hypothetical protein OXJ62_00470 [Spirochaetaceae bacterium]|nr:hypothetical protein [Spirochaetaceae bacterium]